MKVRIILPLLFLLILGLGFGLGFGLPSSSDPTTTKTLVRYLFNKNSLFISEGFTYESLIKHKDEFQRRSYTNVYLPYKLKKAITNQEEVFGSGRELIYQLYEEDIPKGTNIPDNYFQGLNLSSLASLPKEVNEIGRSAFQDNRMIWLRIPKGVTRIKPNAFKNNEIVFLSFYATSLEVIEESVFENNKIDYLSLYGNNSNTQIREIKDSAFKNNEITGVQFGFHLTSIAEEAFMNNKIQSLLLPNTITHIGPRAFANNEFTTPKDKVLKEKETRVTKRNIFIPSTVYSIDREFTLNKDVNLYFEGLNLNKDTRFNTGNNKRIENVFVINGKTRTYRRQFVQDIPTIKDENLESKVPNVENKNKYDYFGFKLDKDSPITFSFDKLQDLLSNDLYSDTYEKDVTFMEDGEMISATMRLNRNVLGFKKNRILYDFQITFKDIDQTDLNAIPSLTKDNQFIIGEFPTDEEESTEA